MIREIKKIQYLCVKFLLNNMRKNYVSTLLAIMLFFIGLESIKGQVGIGNDNPRGLLDINDNLSGDASSGIVLPSVNDVATLIDPSTGSATTIDGTIAYDKTNSCISLFKEGTWDCISSDAPSAMVNVDCDSFTLNGVYIQTVPFDSNNTVSYTVNNDSFTPVTIDFNNVLTITSSVGDAITATATEDYSAVNLISGGTRTLTYQLSGTPSAISTLTLNFKKLGLECSNTIEVLSGGALFTNPVVKQDVSFDDTSVNDNDIQGEFTGVFTVDLPYTSGQGAYDAFNTTFTATDHNGVNQSFTIDYPAGTFAASGVITATITPSVNPFLIPKQQSGIFSIYGTVDTPFTRINLEAIGGILDRNFGDGVHDFVYMPIVAKDGRTWLNNNLGANYANVNHPSFNPTQQATSADDYNAYGSLFQWGRLADGHELITYTSSSVGAGVNGVTGTNATSDTPVNNLFITEGSFPNDWRVPQNSNLWQGESGINNPCPQGYRLPTEIEMNNLVSAESIINTSSAASSSLAFSASGYRLNSNGTVNNVGSHADYWTSTVSGTNARHRVFLSGDTYTYSNYRAFGFGVRCLKD